jgi:Zn-dependent oligopeptidase
VRLTNQQVLPSTLNAFDELLYDVTELFFKLRLIAGTSTDDELRTASERESNKILQYRTNLYLN